MINSQLLFIAVFVPMAGSFLLPMVGRLSERARNALAMIMVLCPLAISIALIPSAYKGNIVTFIRDLPLGFDLILSADSLAVFMAVTSSLIGSIIVMYSFGYIKEYPNRNEYYMMVILFLGSMMGLVFSQNLIFIYLFWEITAIASWRLIGFFRKDIDVTRADKAFLVTVFGALIMLIGFIMIYFETGSFNLITIKAFLMGHPVSNTIVICILIGILTKSATLPFHTWLPDAGVAPSPVTALLHAAVLVKIGVYVFARLFVATLPIEIIWHTVIPAVAAISAIIAAGAALIETDMKRIIAYSTVSQIAYIFLGLAVGGQIAISGGLHYILMHGLAKGGLFLCAGIVEHNIHTKDITKMGGLIRTMPVTAIAFLACSLSVMGIPPFGGFFGKYMVFAGAVETEHFWITGAFLLGAFLTVMYLFRLFNMIFLGEGAENRPREGSPVMVASVVMLAAFSLIAGVFIRYPSVFTQSAIKQMIGM